MDEFKKKQRELSSRWLPLEGSDAN